MTRSRENWIRLRLESLVLASWRFLISSEGVMNPTWTLPTSTSAPVAAVRPFTSASLSSRSPNSSHPPTITNSENPSGRMARQRKTGKRFFFAGAGACEGDGAGAGDVPGVSGVGGMPTSLGPEPAVDIVELRRREGVIDLGLDQPRANGCAVMDDEPPGEAKDREEQHEPSHNAAQDHAVVEIRQPEDWRVVHPGPERSEPLIHQQR